MVVYDLVYGYLWGYREFSKYLSSYGVTYPHSYSWELFSHIVLAYPMLIVLFWVIWIIKGYILYLWHCIISSPCLNYKQEEQMRLVYNGFLFNALHKCYARRKFIWPTCKTPYRDPTPKSMSCLYH